ncbi:MAG: hypothetical protein GC190_19675 [Alphaproteobacteria bacterium]|nr:hypothetical protein [Alphaproteobacteria bacterium]
MSKRARRQYRKLPIGSAERIMRDLLQFCVVIGAPLLVFTHSDRLRDGVMPVIVHLAGTDAAPMTYFAIEMAICIGLMLFGATTVAALFGTRVFFQDQDD